MPCKVIRKCLRLHYCQYKDTEMPFKLETAFAIVHTTVQPSKGGLPLLHGRLGDASCAKGVAEDTIKPSRSCHSK